MIQAGSVLDQVEVVHIGTRLLRGSRDIWVGQVTHGSDGIGPCGLGSLRHSAELENEEETMKKNKKEDGFPQPTTEEESLSQLTVTTSLVCRIPDLTTKQSQSPTPEVESSGTPQGPLVPVSLHLTPPAAHTMHRLGHLPTGPLSESPALPRIPASTCPVRCAQIMLRFDL